MEKEHKSDLRIVSLHAQKTFLYPHFFIPPIALIPLLPYCPIAHILKEKNSNLIIKKKN